MRGRRHYGDTYKWLLLGADNTVFYSANVRKLLARFDPSDPWAISDHLTFRGRRPNLFAPRCLPCGFNASRIAPLGALMQGYEHSLLQVSSEHEARTSKRAKAFKATKVWQAYADLQATVRDGGAPLALAACRTCMRVFMCACVHARFYVCVHGSGRRCGGSPALCLHKRRRHAMAQGGL